MKENKKEITIKSTNKKHNNFTLWSPDQKNDSSNNEVTEWSNGSKEYFGSTSYSRSRKAEQIRDPKLETKKAEIKQIYDLVIKNNTKCLAEKIVNYDANKLNDFLGIALVSLKSDCVKLLLNLGASKEIGQKIFDDFEDDLYPKLTQKDLLVKIEPEKEEKLIELIKISQMLSIPYLPKLSYLIQQQHINCLELVNDKFILSLFTENKKITTDENFNNNTIMIFELETEELQTATGSEVTHKYTPLGCLGDFHNYSDLSSMNIGNIVTDVG